MPDRNSPMKWSSSLRRRRWLVAALLAAVAASLGLTPASPNLALASTGTSSPATMVGGPCTVDGLLMGGCPGGSMTVTPYPGLVAGSETFNLQLTQMTTTPLPNSAYTTWGSGSRGLVTFACSPNCSSQSIQWTYPANAAVIVEFNNLSSTQTTPSCTAPIPTWLAGGGGSYVATDPCVQTADPSCFTAGGCNIPHQFPSTNTYYPIMKLNWNAVLPYVAGPLGTSPTVPYQTLGNFTGSDTLLSSSATTWNPDTYSTYSVPFTQHSISDNYNSYNYASGSYNVDTEYVNGGAQIQTVCGQCGSSYDANCNEDCSYQWLGYCNDQPWGVEGGEGVKNYSDTSWDSKCKAYGDNDDVPYGWQVTQTSWNNTLNGGYWQNTYAEAYAGTIYNKYSGTYDNQTLNTYGSSYTAASTCGGCGSAVQQRSTYGSSYSYQAQVNQTYVLQPGEVSANSSSCPDQTDLSDTADWNGSKRALLAICVPTFYPSNVTVVSTTPTPFTTNGLSSNTITSYSPQSTSVGYQYLSGASGSYTSRWTYSNGSYLGGFNNSGTNWRAYSCTLNGASGDGDGGDGDGAGFLTYYGSCNFHWDSVNTNPWYYTSYGVSSSGNSYSYYNVINTSTTITTAAATTLSYNTVISVTPSYNQLTSTPQSTPITSSFAGVNLHLPLKINQAEGGL